MCVVIPVYAAGSRHFGMPITAAVAGDAVVGAAVVAIAESAARCSVDVATIAEAAKSHGDTTFCATLEKCVAGLRATDHAAGSAIAVLRRRYPHSDMIDALVKCAARPVCTAATNSLVLGRRSFVTGRGPFLLQVWTLLHPGNAVAAAFFDAMQHTQNVMADPEDFLAFFNGAVPAALVERSAQDVSDASAAVDDYVRAHEAL